MADMRREVKMNAFYEEYLSDLDPPLDEELAELFRQAIQPVVERCPEMLPDMQIKVIDWAMGKVFSHVSGEKIKFFMGYPCQ